LLEPFLRICQAAKTELAFRTEPLTSFADLREYRFQNGAVGAGFERIDPAAAGDAGGPEAQQLAKAVEL